MKVPPVKPYRLALKVDAEKKKSEKKKIYYPNVYDEVHCWMHSDAKRWI